MHPYTDIQKPIDTGLKLSPPDSTGVDQISGMSDSDAVSRNENVASLMSVIRTGLVSNERSGGGFTTSFSGASTISVDSCWDVSGSILTGGRG